MPILSDVRERLALPSNRAGERVDLSLVPLPPGVQPSLGAILPGAFAPPTSAGPPAKPWPPQGSEKPPRITQAVVGGRLSWDDINIFGAGLPVILPPDQTADEWRRLDLDASRIKYLPASKLLQVLAEASPDVSRALWDFLRLTNPGWTCIAFNPGTRTPNKAAQVVIDEWTRTLAKRYGSIDVPIGRIHFGAFLRGALMSELVFDADARTPVDLAAPDPASARFKQVYDPVLGRMWALGQFQAGQWVDLSARETISYIPIDPAPASPYGRAPAAPAIFASLFMLGMLHDLRRVVAQQGYPRYDISVNLEALKKATPPNILNDPVQWKQWVDATIIDVQKAYNALEPDSALVHTDVVTINRPTGAVSAEALSGIDPLIRALERQLARSLKTMPLLMGIIEGQSEANANRQWELQAAGIKAIQHLSESDLSEKATLMCEANGIAADCEWRFAELRAAEKYRDAMTKGLEIDNATKLWLMGVIGMKELAHETTGEPPDQEEPRFLPSNDQSYEAAMTTNSPRGDGAPAGPAKGKDKKPNQAPGTGGDNADTGDSQDPNARGRFGLRWPDFMRANGKNGTNGAAPHDEPWKPAGQPLPYVPQDVVYDLGDRRRLLRTWDESVPEAAGLLDAIFENPDTGEAPDDVRRAAEALAQVAHEVRDLVTLVRAQNAAPPSAPAPSPVVKKIERDEQGRIISVTETVDAS